MLVRLSSSDCLKASKADSEVLERIISRLRGLELSPLLDILLAALATADPSLATSDESLGCRVSPSSSPLTPGAGAEAWESRDDRE
eukprot:5770359-Pyramimonas_sp.AAC.1